MQHINYFVLVYTAPPPLPSPHRVIKSYRRLDLTKSLMIGDE